MTKLECCVVGCAKKFPNTEKGRKAYYAHCSPGLWTHEEPCNCSGCRQRTSAYDNVGERFNKNNAAVGKVFEESTNASQVLENRMKHPKRKLLTPAEVADARMKA